MKPTQEELKRNNEIKDALAYHVQSPAQQSANFVDLAEYIQTSGKLTFGNALDKYIRPLVGGDMMILIGRTGNGKTTFSAALARRMAERINSGEIGKEDSIVIFVTLEQQAEYIEVMLAGNERFNSTQIIRGEVPEAEYKKYAITRPSLPMWVIGESRRHARNRERPELFFEGIIRGIEGIVYEYGKDPLIIFVDYLQQCRMQDGVWGDKHKQVMAASMALKGLAMHFDVPVIVPSQAGQHVDDYADKIPRLKDSMWAADATQQADIVGSILRPVRYFDPIDQPFVTFGKNRVFKNSSNLLIFTLLKQRFEEGFGTVGLDFTPQTLRLTDTKIEDYNNPTDEIPF